MQELQRRLDVGQLFGVDGLHGPDEEVVVALEAGIGVAQFLRKSVVVLVDDLAGLAEVGDELSVEGHQLDDVVVERFVPSLHLIELLHDLLAPFVLQVA